MYEVNLIDAERIDVSLQEEETVGVEVRDVLGGGWTLFAVTYTPQKLTEEEKQQARTNIDALANNELSSAIDQALLIAKESGAFKGEKGEKGDDGKNGTNGVDGKDGISATHKWNGTILTVTSASGSSSANLKGDKGEAGANGKDGTNGKDGADGHTPVRGKDYWTDADKAEIVSDVLEEIEIPSGGGKVQDVQVNGGSVVNENGIATIPITANGVYGVVRVGNSANGEMSVGNTNGRTILRYPVANSTGMKNRKSQGAQYGGVIDASNFDFAVKTAMTDGVGAAWTETEQTAARARMGTLGEAEIKAYIEETILGGAW